MKARKGREYVMGTENKVTLGAVIITVVSAILLMCVVGVFCYDPVVTVNAEETIQAEEIALDAACCTSLTCSDASGKTCL